MENSPKKRKLAEVLTSTLLHDMAEGHIEAWKDRYFRKSKKDIRFDLKINHDNCLELERVKEELGRELTSAEEQTVISKFHSAVVKQIY